MDKRPIPGYEGKYWVTEDGRVFNRRGEMRTYELPSGYKRIHFNKDRFLVHRLVAMAFLEKPDGCEFVNHLDGNKGHNHWRNLEWCTKSQNTLHAFETNIRESLKGEDHPAAKLSRIKVSTIRARLANGDSKSAIARDLNVSRWTIRRIDSGESWK